MADVCALIVDGLPAVPLKANTIYRIGKQEGLEICIADESMEFAHGIVSLLRSGIVRIAAVAGRIFVNNEEKQIADIRKEDATEGKVKLRFGNVQASLRFNEAQEEAQDSSGFGEGLKDRTIDTTDDSLCIPETQPPSVNNSVNTTADSFFIPETQAIVFERPTKSGKVSLGDDFMIPETEADPYPAQDTTTRDSDESSGMGSQIRICTQDFNELNEDAIDDFDSSLMLGDALMAFPPPKATKESLEKPEKKQENLLDATDLEMSALNWSASNSKCTVLNSTKADKAQRADACITPDLSAPLADTNRDISTPDIFDLMLANEEEQEAERSRATTPQLCGIKQLVVATIETPRTTQNEEDEASSAQGKNQDMFAAPAFPGNKLLDKTGGDDVQPLNQDFVATQAFPTRQRESLEKPNQDFIATQVFSVKNITPRAGQDSEDELELNQDFVATQAFPRRIPPPTERPNQDFIATQAFPSKSITSRTGQDFIETQPFDVIQAKADSSGNKENIPQDAMSSDSWSDEIEEILNEMISGTVVSSPPDPNEEEIPYVKPCVIKDKDHNRKVFLFENVFPNVNNKNRWKNELAVEEKRCVKRIVSTDSQPPLATPSKRNRRLSEHSERLDADYCLITSRKRPASSQEKDKSEPAKKSVCKDPKLVSTSEKAEQSTEDEAAAPKVPVTKRPTRKAKTKSRSPTPTLESNQVKKATRSRRIESKSKEVKSLENPPKVIRTRRQTKCLEPEEVNAKLPEEIRSKRRAPSTEPTKEEDTEQSATKRGVKKLIESSKKVPEQVTDEAEQPANKRGRKKLIDSAKKDSEESINKRKPPRPRKASSEDSIVQTAKTTRNTRLNSKDDTTTRSKDTTNNNSTNDSLPTSKNESKSEEQLKQLKKIPVVRLKRTESLEGPSTSSVAAPPKWAITEGEEEVSKNRSGATATRLSQPDKQDPLKAINKYVKQAKSEGKIKISFTMCNRQALESVLKALKYVVEITEDPLQCDLLIMDKGERTYKFLTVIASNKPVLSTKWLESVKATKSITVQDDHLFKDPNFEKVFKFNPLSVLEHPRLFNGLNFMLCEGIQPNANEMKAIIESAGGRVHSKPPPLGNCPDLYVVTTKKDEHTKRRLRTYDNIHYIKTEGVMQSLVQHKAELLGEHKLKL